MIMSSSFLGPVSVLLIVLFVCCVFVVVVAVVAHAVVSAVVFDLPSGFLI